MLKDPFSESCYQLEYLLKKIKKYNDNLVTNYNLLSNNNSTDIINF